MAEATDGAREFVGDVQNELRKVTWPDQDTLRNSTAITLGFMVAVAVVIFGVDLVVRGALRVVLSLFGA